jgi:two-component system nitrate/nitrite sensor histidine kinase NarX
MHDKLEERVREKTNKLKQRNKSLELLYQTSHNLVSPTRDEDYKILLNRIEETLDNGRLMLCLKNSNNQHRLRPISNHTLPNNCDHSNDTCDFCSTPNTNNLSFNIKKNDDDFGFLRYIDENIAPLKQWQSHLLRAVADNIAVAISLDKKRSQEALLALQEERTVIARELHDSLAQSLSYMKMQTSVLAKQLDRDMPRSRIDGTIDDLREGLSDAYRQLRELLTTFRLQVSDASLGSTLNAIAIEFTHKCNHPVALDDNLVSDTLSPNEKIHLLQIVREALSNIQRHAQASEARISLSQHQNKLQVSISDNGIGLSTAKLSGARYGISIMNERADSLGAKLEITPVTIGGTEVKFEFVPSSMKSTIDKDVDTMTTA